MRLRVRSSQDIVKSIDRELESYFTILRCVDLRMAACKTRRNDYSPITTVSQDITRMIFNQILGEWRGSRGYYGCLFCLRSVCRSWNLAILGHFSFWLPIFPEHSSSLHAFTIPLTKNHPLVVHFSGNQWKPDHPPTQEQNKSDQFLVRAMSDDWPIGSLTYRESRSIPSESPVYALLSKPAPHMEALTLSFLGTIDRLFGGVAPKLKVISLDRVGLGSGITGADSLRQLELGSVQHLTHRKLRKILIQSPGLEVVTLRSTRFEQPTPGGTAMASESESPIFLHKLRHINLFHILAADARAIIAQIEVPRGVKLLFYLVDRDYTSLRDLIDHVTIQVPSTAGIEATFRSGDSVQLEALSKEWSVFSDIDATSRGGRSLHEFFKAKVSPATRSLVTSARIPVPSSISETFKGLDAVFPNLTSASIGLARWGASERPTFGSLCEPGAHGPQWRCSNLQDLTQDMGPFRLDLLQDLEETMQRRSKAASTGLVKTGLRSCRLKVAGRISTDGGAALEKMRAVVEIVEVEKRPGGIIRGHEERDGASEIDSDVEVDSDTD